MAQSQLRWPECLETYLGNHSRGSWYVKRRMVGAAQISRCSNI